MFDERDGVLSGQRELTIGSQKRERNRADDGKPSTKTFPADTEEIILAALLTLY
ncbi:hypothetical protein [Serratia rhizosphaerae]|uniref:hypothetical protein n=1 Tax=Serratia rhizosphaerae TaxID=2597702 RepID=UPI001359D4A7|nr:hypothetical protein [Serratia rhizosphaerae]MEB6334106.1 hypothetical protein [Serratia rhizosphaerae]